MLLSNKGDYDKCLHNIMNSYNQVIPNDLDDWIQEDWIFLIKPDGLELVIEDKPFEHLLYDVLRKLWFEIKKQKNIILTLEQLKLVFTPFGSSENFRDWWKQDFESHMLWKQMKLLLLSHTNTCYKTLELKKIIRYHLLEMKDKQEIVIRNLLHSVDKEDFDISYKILFT